MMNRIIEAINTHKHKSTIPIIDNQIAYTPLVEDAQVEYMCFNYLIGSDRKLVNQGLEACFRMHFIKEKFMPPRKAVEYSVGEWEYTHLVDNLVLQPFMLFINGRFIPWDLIRVARTREINYVIVDTSKNGNFTPLIRNIKYVQTISLPVHMRYVSKENIKDTDDISFTFDEYGIYNPETTDHVIIDDKANHTIHKFWSTTTGVNAFPVIQERTVKLTDKNVILFKNGLLATGKIYNVRRAFDWEKTDKDNKGEILNYYLDFNNPGLEMEVFPSIKFDSELLTINDGTTGDPPCRYDFGIFINTKYTETCDNINRADLEGLTPWIQDQTAGINDPKFIRDLQIPFEMQMSRKKKYDENVADAIDTMMGYNASLFNEVYKDTSNLVVEERDGQWALDTVHSDGALWLSRSHKDFTDEYILMLVNGELYKYTKMIKYRSNHCIIPIQDINPDDTIDILRFRNVNNYISNITIGINDGFQSHADYMINDNMVLYSTIPDEDIYQFPKDGMQHFPVKYSLEYDDEGNTRIVLEDEKYYDKPLKLGYKNRFMHFTYHIRVDDPDAIGINSYKVDLGDKFMYCHDYSRYMIFLNGRRLCSDQFRLALPVRSGTPFFEFRLYVTAPLKEGDLIDVVYVPVTIKDIKLIDIPKPWDIVYDIQQKDEPSVGDSIIVVDVDHVDDPRYDAAILEAIYKRVVQDGDIIVDKSKLGYPLSKDLYMVWVNGKKIPSSYLVDIDSTYMKIVTDVHSTHSIFVTKYISDIEVLREAFHKEIDVPHVPGLFDKVFDTPKVAFEDIPKDAHIENYVKGTPAGIDLILDIFKVMDKDDRIAIWDRVLRYLSKSDIFNLLGIKAEEITDTETNIYENNVTVRAMMDELIRQEVLTNPIIERIYPYIFDYDDVDDNFKGSIGRDYEGHYVYDALNGNSETEMDIPRPRE